MTDLFRICSERKDYLVKDNLPKGKQMERDVMEDDPAIIDLSKEFPHNQYYYQEDRKQGDESENDDGFIPVMVRKKRTNRDYVPVQRCTRSQTQKQ